MGPAGVCACVTGRWDVARGRGTASGTRVLTGYEDAAHEHGTRALMGYTGTRHANMAHVRGRANDTVHVSVNGL
eukprot:3790447-Prymnesium_polylepis.1